MVLTPRSRPAPPRARHAFSLVEVIVASVIAALVAGATVSAVSQLLRVKSRSSARQQAAARADAAATRIARDLMNVVRDADLKSCRVTIKGGGGGSTDDTADELLLLTRSRTPIRADEWSGEGGEYEVQYRLMPGVRGEPALWRRIDQAFDAYQDAGGMAAPVVGGVTALSLEATDGNQWFEAWDSDSDGMPHAVRVVVTGQADDGRTTAVARRVVAIDRVPQPYVPAEESGASTPSGGTPTSPTGGGGS